MGAMPFQIVGVWIRGLLSILLLAAGPYLLYHWYERTQVMQMQTVAVPTTQSSGSGVERQAAVEPTGKRVLAPNWGFNGQTSLFVVGLGMLLWALPKGPRAEPAAADAPPGPDEPHSMRTGEVQRIDPPRRQRVARRDVRPARRPAGRADAWLGTGQ